jgi:hypothetical protein
VRSAGKRPPHMRVDEIILNKLSRTAEKGWLSSLEVGRGANNSTLQKLRMLQNTAQCVSYVNNQHETSWTTMVKQTPECHPQIHKYSRPTPVKTQTHTENGEWFCNDNPNLGYNAWERKFVWWLHKTYVPTRHKTVTGRTSKSRTGRSRVRFLEKKGIISSAKLPDHLWGTPKFQYNERRGALSPGVKRPACQWTFLISDYNTNLTTQFSN